MRWTSNFFNTWSENALSLVPLCLLAEFHTAIEQNGNAADEHAEVGAGFMKEAEEAIARDDGRLKAAEGMAEEDWDFGGDEGGDDDDQQQYGGVACVETEDHGRAGEDFNDGDEGGEEVGKGQADVGEASAAEFAGKHELENAFDKKHRAHDHADENHGKALAHENPPDRE